MIDDDILQRGYQPAQPRRLALAKAEQKKGEQNLCRNSDRFVLNFFLI
jgi:hypothetical protein